MVNKQGDKGQAPREKEAEGLPSLKMGKRGMRSPSRKNSRGSWRVETDEQWEKIRVKAQ